MSTVCLLSISLSILWVLLGCAGAGTKNYFDYIVVGAGPGGLQLGYFLQQNNRNYVILERNNVSGSFFTVYPRHDQLISINKRHTGKTNKEFNLRHDWNSLISHDESLLFKHYSKEFFPDRRAMLQYLNDYQQKLGIQVRFNTEVSNIYKMVNTTTGKSQFYMNDQHGNQYICKTLVLATGLGKPNIPKFNGSEFAEGYETLSTNPDDYEGQTVLILGRGNSAFEVANSIYGATNMVHMMGRSRVRLSWATHYVGDLRGVNNNLLDTYMLKSLDALFDAPMEIVVLQRNEKDQITLSSVSGLERMVDNNPARQPYDRVLRCLGFMFDPDILRKAFNNELLDTYQLKSLDGLFEWGPVESFCLNYTEANKLYACSSSPQIVYDNDGFRAHYDKVLRCLGFTFDSEVFAEAVNSELLDTYMLKSQDAIFEAGTDAIAIRQTESGQFHLHTRSNIEGHKDNFALRGNYDRVLRCLGFNSERALFSKGVNNELLDTYQLKSLDALVESTVDRIHLHRLPSGQVHLSMIEDTGELYEVRAADEYDRVLLCLGFKFDWRLLAKAVNNNLLDTYQLKSLDTVFEAPVESLDVHRLSNGRIQLTDDSVFDNFALRDEYDKVLRCLGFKFEPGIFGNDSSMVQLVNRQSKYPEIGHNYESLHVSDLYFAGTNSHQIDHRQSSGGFIHGFRYTARALSHLLEWKNHGVQWPSTRYHVNDLVSVMTKRINEVSALYQMFGGFLGDIYIFREKGTEVDLLEEVPLYLLSHLETSTGHAWSPLIAVSLEYGPDFSGPGKDVFRGDRATGEPSEAHTSNFLHPVYYYYESPPTDEEINRKQKQKKKHKYYNLPTPKRIHFTIEDFLTAWDAERSHILPLRRFLESILETDLRNHFAEECMKMALVFSNVPNNCNKFLHGQGILGTEALIESAFKSGLMLS